MPDQSDHTALVCSSDRRLKKNVKPIIGALASVLALDPVTFQWKSEFSEQQTHLGFIAQEVETVLPGLVSKDAKELETLNESGMIPYLVEAIKEIQAEVAALKKKP